MIRDPSDGTVREKPTCKDSLQVQNSGLPTDRLKADEIERLKQSRDWLKSYFHRRTEAKA